MKIIIFPDTNIFLHFKPLDQIDLPEVYDCNEVEVILAPVVLDELNNHKSTHQIIGLRKRADASLKRIVDWKRTREIRPGVTFALRPTRPANSTFDAHQLRRQHGDDRLFAAMLEYMSEYPEAVVRMVTADIGTTLRAEHFGIVANTLRDAYRLPAADDAEKQIRQLKAQVRRLENRLPSLSLMFLDGSNRCDYKLAPQINSLTEEMRDELNEAVAKLQAEARRYLEPYDQATRSGVRDLTDAEHSILRVGELMGRPDKEELENYRAAVQAYPEAYERHLMRRSDAMNSKRRTLSLELLLRNEGGAPGLNVELILRFQESCADKLRWHANRSSPVSFFVGDPPAPPDPPVSPVERFMGESRIPSWMQDTMPAPLGIARQLATDPTPEPRVDGRSLTYYIESAPHKRTVTLQPVLAMFVDSSAIKNIDIEATARANISSHLPGYRSLNLKRYDGPGFHKTEMSEAIAKYEELLDRIRKDSKTDYTYSDGGVIVKLTAAELNKLIFGTRQWVYNEASRIEEVLEFGQVPITSMERRFEFVDSQLLELMPDAATRLMTAYRNLSEKNPENWVNVADSCRRVIKDFADAMYPARAEPAHSLNVTEQAYLNRIRAFVKDTISSRRQRKQLDSVLDLLGELLARTDNLASRSVHSGELSRFEAERILIYTYLAIGDMLMLSGFKVRSDAVTDRVNLNRASCEQLQTGLGVNAKVAAEIVNARKYRNLDSWEQVAEIKGIGPKTLEKIRPLASL